MPSPTNVYCYVDGESHYIRSEQAYKQLHGPDVGLLEIPTRFPNALHNGAELFAKAVDPKLKLFWDTRWPYNMNVALRGPITRQVYCTSFTGAPEDLHAAKVKLRNVGFEPHVIPEIRQLARQREHILKESNIIEKAKGVDIGLAVRILEDAYHDNFQSCLLFTSDVDYLPVIEAVRRKGKVVTVAGYASGLAKESPLLYVPDAFVGLEDLMKRFYAP